MDTLTTTIAESTLTPPPRWGLTASGCTRKSGAPTQYMVRLKGETLWRRLMCWQFSNAGTLFLRIKGKCLIVSEHQIPR